MPVWANFRQRALDVAILEINAKTDLKIKLTSIERSKHRRVVALTFTINQALPKAVVQNKIKHRRAYFFWPDIPSAQCALIRGSVPPFCLQCEIASLVAASALDSWVKLVQSIVSLFFQQAKASLTDEALKPV
jgi:hypothetical protein